MYTVEKIFEPQPHAQYIITVKANGGSVTLAVEHSPGVYVPGNVYTADGANLVVLDRARFRITPVGGAEYRVV